MRKIKQQQLLIVPEMKTRPPLSAEELFILVGFLPVHLLLKGFLSLTCEQIFALPQWVGESLTTWIKWLGLWGCWKFWVIVFTNGFPISNFANHSTSLRLSDKHSYAIYLPGCGEVKIRSMHCKLERNFQIQDLTVAREGLPFN